MDREPLTIYKLMIMDILGKVDFPLTNSQISQFILEKGYTGYFNIQQAISDLTDTSLIIANRIYNTSYFSLTRAGKDTLESFRYKLSDQIQTEITEYIKKNRYHFRNENELTADYVKTEDDNFRVICEVRGSRELISNITMNVTSEETAIAICDNWPERYEEIYSFLVQKLMLREGKIK